MFTVILPISENVYLELGIEKKENFKQKNDLIGLFYLYKNGEKLLISDDYITDIPEIIISYLQKIPENTSVESENYMGERYN
ncbi:MAG: hypothetical protein LBL93_03740, partial [Ruminococcus sp.]|nr:hypothetical protein [Ruminococcus sp.]